MCGKYIHTYFLFYCMPGRVFIDLIYTCSRWTQRWPPYSIHPSLLSSFPTFGFQVTLNILLPRLLLFYNIFKAFFTFTFFMCLAKIFFFCVSLSCVYVYGGGWIHESIFAYITKLKRMYRLRIYIFFFFLTLSIQ